MGNEGLAGLLVEPEGGSEYAAGLAGLPGMGNEGLPAERKAKRKKKREVKLGKKLLDAFKRTTGVGLSEARLREGGRVGHLVSLLHARPRSKFF